MDNIPTKPFVLVDGSSYLYRAFHALPPLTNSKGEPTGAIYGVVNMLRRLLLDYDPDYCAIVFDAPGKTFRDDLYAEYKSNRPAMPDDLQAQIAPLHAIVEAMGLPLLIIEGVEADDVIGTLATQASREGMHTLISTGDKDFAQLVNKHITLINTMSGTVMDPDGVVQKFGVTPDQIIDYLALIGDTSDNVPGVPNVGPKTAVKWLTAYGSLDKLLKNADKITGKVGDNLRASLAQLPLSRELVTIKQDVSLALKPKELKFAEKNIPVLIDWFKRLEFKGWLSELLETDASTESSTPQEQKKYQIILEEKVFESWLSQLQKAELFAFDTETTSLEAMSAEVVGVSFAMQAGVAAYLPFAHDYLGAPTQLSREWVLKKLKPLLEDPKKKKVGHHLKYDKNVLANHHIDLQGIAYDTMIESYVLDSTGSRHDMDTLALKYLGHKTISFTDVAGKGAKQLTFNQVHLEEAGPYAAEDADITLQLHEALSPKLAENKGLSFVFNNIEMPLVPVLSRMEQAGVLIDTKMLSKQSASLAKRLSELEKTVYTMADGEFNLSSPKQLQEILYTKLALPVLKKTPTGQPSTAEEVLQELALTYPLPSLILEYRSLSKLKSTYTDRLPEQVNAKTGRVHTSYLQAVAATGRLASSDPNLQNIPIRTEEGRKIRQAFIVPPGFKLVAADYSQIELRIMAHLSQDAGLLAAFEQGLDIHKATAAEVFSVPLDAVTDDQRRSAKAINFGLIYGMSSFGLARQLGVDRQAAQMYMDCYFARYPGVKNYMENTRKLAKSQGYVETLFGRRLFLPEIRSSNHQRQKAAERAAINAPLQGTAADIIKRAMITVDEWLTHSHVNARMIMQVHDELVLEVLEADVAQVVEHLKSAMMGAAELAVPLLVDVGIGNNWDEAH
jgi:DNA polymerase-1